VSSPPATRGFQTWLQKCWEEDLANAEVAPYDCSYNQHQYGLYI